MYTIAIAPGDGIGPEIMHAVLRIFNAARVPLQYEPVQMGKSVFEQGFNTGVTPEAKAIIEKLGILFKGPMETPKGKGMKSINVTARKVWNTYANKRVFRSLSGVETVFSKAGIPVDITIVRENIEDTYGGIEHMLTPDVALCRRFITRPGSLQVHRYAFDMAVKKGAKKITCGHKANIMKLTDGLFLETFYEVAKDYPQIQADDMIVDDLAMKLVVKPHQFDVIVLPNLQGDIISDLCAGLVGGLGFAPSANIGDHISIFEAVHGTAPDIAGRNLANPTSLLLSGCMMLRHLGFIQEAVLIENALFYTLEQGIHTADFGQAGTEAMGTEAFADAIIAHVGKEPVKPVVAPTAPVKPYQQPEALTENRLIQSGRMVEEMLAGADYFVAWTGQPAELGRGIEKRLPAGYKLSTISNRGTQVYPEGSLFTDCVDQYRVRVEAGDGHKVTEKEILQLAMELGDFARICSVEMLRINNGQRGYSLAQGQ